MSGKNVEMTYLWEAGTSFFTTESPFLSVQDNFFLFLTSLLEYNCFTTLC